MKIRLIALSVAFAAGLCAQHRFSWQEACFKNPGAPFCQGNEYAVKKTAPPKDGGKTVVTNPVAGQVAPSGIDWRFVDPQADAIAGVNLAKLSAAPLAHRLLTELAASQGFTDVDIAKLFEALPGADQVGISVRDNRVVVLVAGHLANGAAPAPASDWKVLRLSTSAMLIGHADAVDQAAQRVAAQAPIPEAAESADDRQAAGGFWVVASPKLLGPQAQASKLKQFTLLVAVQDRLVSDAAFELTTAPDETARHAWPASVTGATVDGSTVHLKMSIDAGAETSAFRQVIPDLLGQQLVPALQAARFFPPRQTAVVDHSKPVIYGLDDGPRQLSH